MARSRARRRAAGRAPRSIAEGRERARPPAPAQRRRSAEAMKSLSPRLASALSAAAGEARQRLRLRCATRGACSISNCLMPSRPAAFGPSGSAASPANGRGRAARRCFICTAALLRGVAAPLPSDLRGLRFAGFSVFTPAYRLAPRHPFPAALDDALAACAALAERGGMVIAGDSAGGGLALSLMMSRRDAGLPLPAAALCSRPGPISPSPAPRARKRGERPAVLAPHADAARAYLGEREFEKPAGLAALRRSARPAAAAAAREHERIAARRFRAARGARGRGGRRCARRAMAGRAALLATGGGADAAGARVDRAGGGVFTGEGGGGAPVA